jgi:D-sedoheptulose 7-phosphate isomerase
MSNNTEKIFKIKLSRLNEALSAVDMRTLADIVDVLLKSIRRKKKILVCGNGGSASDSQHLTAELVGKFVKIRRPVACISLNADTSTLTCISNDFGYEQAFSRQIEGIGNKGDVLVVFSTSGDSKNVLLAVQTAKICGLTTVAFLGRNGGGVNKHADYSLVIRSEQTDTIQECHEILMHTVVWDIEELLEDAEGLQA